MPLISDIQKPAYWHILPIKPVYLLTVVKIPNLESVKVFHNVIMYV